MRVKAGAVGGGAALALAAVLLLGLLAGLAMSPAAAQTGLFVPPRASVAAPPSDPAAVDGYVARLDDAATRVLLIERLKAETAAAAEPRAASSLGAVARGIMTVRDAGGAAIGRLGALRAGLADIEAQGDRVVLLMSDLRGWPAVWDGLRIDAIILVATVFLVFAGSLLAHRLSGGAIARPGTAMAIVADGARMIGVFVLANLMILLAYTREDPLRELPTALALWGALTYAVQRIATHAGSPHRTALTLSAAFALFGMLGQGVLQIYGLREELNCLFLAVAGSIAFAILMPLAGVVFPRPPLGAAQQARGDWPLALPLLVGLWLVWLVDVLAGRGEGASAAALTTAALAALSHFRTPRAAGWGRAWAQPAQMALVVLTAVAAVQALGADLVGFLATATGHRLIAGATNSALIIVLALFGWTWLSRWVDARIGIDSGDSGASAMAQSEGEGGTAKVGTRAQTLLPLIRTTVAIALIIMVGLTVLSSFGVDITPLLAGAGIVGIAVGFGAQSLVRDVFSGIFFLIDDAFRVGEYIEFGEIRGEVERISIRSLTLRHHRGAVHTVPFGEIRSITNYNRDWVIMKLRFTLRYDTDVEKVRKIVKQIGLALAADPVHGANLLEPPKSQGILEFTDSGVIVRVKFKCKPREQFVLRRVLNERLMAEFAKAGIRFAFPTVTVERRGDADGEDEAAAQTVRSAALPAKQA